MLFVCLFVCFVCLQRPCGFQPRRHFSLLPSLIKATLSAKARKWETRTDRRWILKKTTWAKYEKRNEKKKYNFELSFKLFFLFELWQIEAARKELENLDEEVEKMVDEFDLEQSQLMWALEKRKAPVLAKRKQAIQKIPNFWAVVVRLFGFFFSWLIRN